MLLVKNIKFKLENLKETLTNKLTELLKNEQNIFTNAKNSPDYTPKLFGEVDFEKYEKLLPQNIENLKFSIYSSGQSNPTFPELDYDSLLYKAINKDVSSLDLDVKEKDKAKGLFSGRGRMEKDKKALKSK